MDYDFIAEALFFFCSAIYSPLFCVIIQLLQTYSGADALLDFVTDLSEQMKPKRSGRDTTFL